MKQKLVLGAVLIFFLASLASGAFMIGRNASGTSVQQDYHGPSQSLWKEYEIMATVSSIDVADLGEDMCKAARKLHIATEEGTETVMLELQEEYGAFREEYIKSRLIYLTERAVADNQLRQEVVDAGFVSAEDLPIRQIMSADEYLDRHSC